MVLIGIDPNPHHHIIPSILVALRIIFSRRSNLSSAPSPCVCSSAGQGMAGDVEPPKRRMFSTWNFGRSEAVTWNRYGIGCSQGKWQGNQGETMENDGKTWFVDGKTLWNSGNIKGFSEGWCWFFAGNFMEFHVHFINSMNTSCTFRWELLQGPWIGFCWGFNGNFIINIGQASQVYGKKNSGATLT